MKKSIEKKYVLIFSLFVSIVIFICWCANALLLSRYYVSRKIVSLQNVFTQLDDVAGSYGIDSPEFSTVFESGAEIFSCDILILEQDMTVKEANVVDSETLKEKLIKYFFGEIDPMQRIIEKTDKYTMHSVVDFETGSEYLEVWGVMSTGNPIIIRSAVSGIHDNARLANVFLAYVGIFAIIISYFFSRFLSRTITQPILRIVDISDKMAKLDFDAKYEGDDENEIGLLGQHINKLSETLEKTISELKTANAELESELKKRIEIDDMRKEFLSNVSHELKTPIALIQGYAEGLSDCVNDDAESREFYCEVITDESQKMNRLVKSLLELNELEFGQNNLNIERFDIIELIKNCINASDILLKQQEISIEFDDSVQKYVWSDEYQIERVFNNYLSNAIHYASGDNKIIRIRTEQMADKLRVSVFNTGDCIPEEALPHLWTKFYKVDKARTREYGGSGVGLSIVKATMETLNQHYGVLNLNDGVEFWFEVDSK